MACKRTISKKKMGLGGILSSTASGAKLGSNLGPIGAGIGAGIGLIGGLIKDKQEADNLYNLNRKKYSQDILANTLIDPTFSNNTPLMPMGGMIPGETVELERGESYMMPNGQIDMISNQAPTHAQGGVPINLPADTKVLGKKPAYDDKTFKQLGAKLKRKGDKYRKVLEGKPTKIEERTANLMLDKINKEFDALFMAQGEDIGGPTMPDGGKIKPASYKVDSTITSNYRPSQIITQDYGDFDKAINGDLLRSTPLYDPNNPKNIVAVEAYYKGIPTPQYILPGDTNSARMERYDINGKTRFAGSEFPDEEFAQGGKIFIKPSKRGTFTTAAKKHGKSVQGFASQVLANKDNYSTVMVKKANFARNASKWRKGQTGLKVYSDVFNTSGYDYFNQNPAALMPFQKQYGLTMDNVYGPDTANAYNMFMNPKYGVQKTDAIQSQLTGAFNPLSELNNAYQGTTATPTQQYTNNNQNINWGGALSTIGSLAPVAYNLYQGLQKPDLVDKNAFANPYESQIRSTMANRRYNINPELEANRLAEATYYRNLREGAPSQAQYLGGLQAGQISTQRANAASLARKQNIDNEYLAQQAQMDASLGQAQSERARYIEDTNARTKAVQRNMIGTGLGQLSQFTQNRQLMNNQMVRDAQRLNLLPSLVQNFTLNSDGTWTYKKTNETISSEEVFNIIKGLNVR